jgi:hypothetical protein
MPYKDPAEKRAWEESHRGEQRRRFKDAAAWADSQIALLDAISPRQETRRELRTALIDQFLRDRYGLGNDTANSDPTAAR